MASVVAAQDGIVPEEPDFLMDPDGDLQGFGDYFGGSFVPVRMKSKGQAMRMLPASSGVPRVKPPAPPPATDAAFLKDVNCAEDARAGYV